MLIPILIGVLVVVAGGLIFIATRSETFRIERSAEIGASGDVVFALINDLHEWEKWSPFEKFDPQMKKIFGEKTAGAGATYSWSGNSRAGEGRMTIEESKPNELVGMKLEFVKPFAAVCKATFVLVPHSAGTRVSWIMEGTKNFVSKAFHLFMNMDKMVGKDFDEGLANLNRLAQSRSQIHP